MNLKPIVEWGLSVIQKIKVNNGLNVELERLNCILEYEEIVRELKMIVDYAIPIQEELKNNGLSRNSIKRCKSFFGKDKLYGKVKKFEIQILEYLNNMIKNEAKGAKLVCTSDILESSFGKYKNCISNNTSIGITDLSLSVAAFTVDFENDNEIRNALSNVKVKNIGEWKTQNIGKTLIAKRLEVLKCAVGGKD